MDFSGGGLWDYLSALGEEEFKQKKLYLHKRRKKSRRPQSPDVLRKRRTFAAEKRQVWKGKLTKTASGLFPQHLTESKTGKIVSRKRSAKGKLSPWIRACSAARIALGITGFAPVKKGSPLYNRAKQELAAIMGS